LLFGAIVVLTFSHRSSVSRAAEKALLGQLQRELASRFGIDLVPASPQAFVEHALAMLPPNTRGMSVTRPDVLREKLLEMVSFALAQGEPLELDG
jgi:hypothetical protein